MIGDAISFCITTALAVWAALTALNQFSQKFSRSDRRSRLGRLIWWIKARDRLSLLPIWTFFAPNPRTRDHDVYFRDRLVDGTITPWHAVCDNCPSLGCVSWNPRKRLKKAILDMSNFLVRSAHRSLVSKGDHRLILVTVPYLGLAIRVSGIERGPLSVTRSLWFRNSSGRGLCPASAPPPDEEECLWTLLHLQEHGAGPDVPDQHAEIFHQRSQLPHPGASDEPLHPFLFFHKRLCGPLANSRFHHRPDPVNPPNSKLEAAYHKADKAIENILTLLLAA